MIHPTAIIEPGARLGKDCEIHAHAIIRKHAVLGDRVVVHPFAVIGGDPQFLKFDPATESEARIGNNTVIRESVTVNRSIYPGKATVIGENCFLMACSHVGHDCEIGNNVVLANASLLGGHVLVSDNVFIGGGAAVHQFSRIGEGTMVGGLTRLSRDAAPFTMVAERDEVAGLNVVGLKRRNVPREAIREIKEAFREVYHQAGNIRAVATAALDSGRYQSAEAKRFLEFFKTGKRSFARPARHASTAVEEE